MTQKKNIAIVLSAGTLLLAAIVSLKFGIKQENRNSISERETPGEWFFMQRAFPYGFINKAEYKNAVMQAMAMKTPASNKQGLSIAMGPKPIWKLAGPTNIGGRVSDVEMDPTNQQIIYAGIASGGIFKSTNGGTIWNPIFDNAPNLSIGDIGISPSNPSIIYVGTGESNGGGGSQTYDGLGVYKSTNAGATWSYVGLDSVGSIGRVIVDPKNPNRAFVAAMGDLFGKDSKRGIYRTTNGGTTWQKVLYVTDSTGGVDLAINPINPDTIYAATWERVRTPYYHTYGGVTSNVYRSYNGGNTWTKLTNGIPSNVSTNGRIGIGICNTSPNVLYAIYADAIGNFKGIFKTTDYGTSWVQTNDGSLSGMYATYGWWNGKITVDPNNANIVYAVGFDTYKSTNGGGSWANTTASNHVDHHALYVHPLNSNLVLDGNDGGIYISTNAGSTYTKPALPITQFYTSEIDYTTPARLYGGAQDNNVIRTTTGALNNWTSIVGGDGFYTLVDPTNNAYVYGESQYGAMQRSTNGGGSFSGGTSGISGTDRQNWNTPFVFDPSNPVNMYYGSNRLWKSTNRAVSWTVISPDLTNGVTAGNLVWSTITTIAVAKSNANVIYVGTDDGNIQVTTNGGANWTKVSTSLPKRWVTRVAVDPVNPAVAYATVSGYRWDEYLPHVYKTTNTGATWTDISSNLPGAPVNDIVLDPVKKDSTYYVASDVGVYYTTDAGTSWSTVGDSLPNVPITDLTIHAPSKILVAATFGRSMWKLDLNQVSVTAVKNNSSAMVQQKMEVYPNPFSKETTIAFNNDKEQNVKVEVFDLTGRSVAVLFDGSLPEGKQKFNWNETENYYNALSSGTYICRIITKDEILTKKISLNK